MRLKFPVMRDPWTKKRYVICLHAPVTPADPRKSPRHCRLVGLGRDDEKRQFTVPMQKWELLRADMVSFVETTIPRGAVVGAGHTPIAGSRISDPWTLSLFVVRCSQTSQRIAVAHAGLEPDRVAILGSRDDGKMVRTHISIGNWEKAKLTPVRFVEVEDILAPVTHIADPLPP